MKNLIYMMAFLSCTLIFGQNKIGFEKANELYNEGNYTEAIEYYERILDTEVSIVCPEEDLCLRCHRSGLLFVHLAN